MSILATLESREKQSQGVHNKAMHNIKQTSNSLSIQRREEMIAPTTEEQRRIERDVYCSRAQGWFQIVPIKKGVGREKQSEGLRTAHKLGAQFSQRIAFVYMYLYILDPVYNCGLIELLCARDCVYIQEGSVAEIKRAAGLI